LPKLFVTNQSLDLAGELLASAHALSVLAQRVPSAAKSTLSEPDRQLLGRLRDDYLRSIAHRFFELGRLGVALLSRKRRYQRTAQPITAGGKEWPEKGVPVQAVKERWQGAQ
jgi:hypothetical protein